MVPKDPWANWLASENWAALLNDDGWGVGVWKNLVGGQAPTLAPADADFRPTHPAITWLDQRPSAEADRMYARLGEPVPVWGSWPSQAGWFLRNRPEAAAPAQQVRPPGARRLVLPVSPAPAHR